MSTSPAPGAPAQFLVVEVEDVAFWPERPEPLRRVIAFELDGGFTEALRADRLRHPRPIGGHA